MFFLSVIGLIILAFIAIRFAVAAIPLMLIIFALWGAFDKSLSTGSSNRIMSYAELEKYPSSCEKASDQLAELKSLQKRLNFKSDPEDLSDNDRAYNNLLKATIWWYAYQCNKS